MSCKQENKRLADIKRMRDLAKKSASMDQCVYVLFEKEDGSFGFDKENENYKGRLIEYIYW